MPIGRDAVAVDGAVPTLDDDQAELLEVARGAHGRLAVDAEVLRDGRDAWPRLGAAPLSHR